MLQETKHYNDWLTSWGNIKLCRVHRLPSFVEHPNIKKMCFSFQLRFKACNARDKLGDIAERHKKVVCLETNMIAANTLTSSITAARYWPGDYACTTGVSRFWYATLKKLCVVPHPANVSWASIGGVRTFLSEQRHGLLGSSQTAQFRVHATRYYMCGRSRDSLSSIR